MAAAMWSLVTPWVPRRPLRALVVFVAAQPALLYAYALQGSVKEIAAIWIIVLVAALIPEWRRSCRDGPRRVIPLTIASAAALNILSMAIVPWLAPLLAIALVSAVWGARLRGAALARSVGLFAVARRGALDPGAAQARLVRRHHDRPSSPGRRSSATCCARSTGFRARASGSRATTACRSPATTSCGPTRCSASRRSRSSRWWCGSSRSAAGSCWVSPRRCSSPRST